MPKLADELAWDVRLHYRRGGGVRLAGIHVYYEFRWVEYMPDRRMQFRNGQCLAERVLDDCPEGKLPALLLTNRDEVEEGARVTASFYVVVLNLPRYLEQAEANAAVSYLAGALGPITRARQLRELAAADEGELRALIQLRLDAGEIDAWARGSPERLAELRRLASRADPVAAAIEAVESLGGLDPDFVAALGDLAVKESDRDKRLDLLRAITGDATGRHVAGEVLGERLEERLNDAESAASEYQELLAGKKTTETDLQHFLEQNPWLLGLEYARVRPRQQILRGTVDFLLERFDGFCDLLELKSPNDGIVVSSKQGDGPPPASAYALSAKLAEALAQVHVYRDALREDQIAEKYFGLQHTADPQIIVVIGNARRLSAPERRVLIELNRSLHRVEVLPYDVLGERAEAVLRNVRRQLLTLADPAA
jgi:Domain of unknown function (DUF4263)